MRSMGNFYVNVTLKGPDRSDIAEYLQRMGCKAYLTPAVDSVTTLCEEQCDSQDGTVISRITQDLSGYFHDAALAVVNHDDDVLAYVLYDKGERHHAYNSSPWYVDGAQLGGDFDLPEDQITSQSGDRNVGPELPAGGDAEALVRLLGNAANLAAVNQVLSGGADAFAFAVERHEALLKALGLPDHALCFGYRYLSRGEAPPGMTEDSILKVGGASD